MSRPEKIRCDDYKDKGIMKGRKGGTGEPLPGTEPADRIFFTSALLGIFHLALAVVLPITAHIYENEISFPSI